MKTLLPSGTPLNQGRAYEKVFMLYLWSAGMILIATGLGKLLALSTEPADAGALPILDPVFSVPYQYVI